MKHNVLVVDDESQILSALQRTLRNQDFSLFMANDGEEALAILADKQVDLIISDYMMPGLSGTELLTKAEEIQPDSIRMILSGHSDFQNVMDSMKSGIVHKFLAKPWSNNVLIKQINDSLASKKIEEQAAHTATTKQNLSPAPEFYEIQTDLDNTMLTMASELESVFGYSNAEIQGQSFALLITERSYQQHLDYIATKDEGGDWKASAKNRIAQTKQHKPFPISLAASKTDDKITYFIKSLAAQHAPQQATVYTTKNAYVLLDTDGKIVKFNQKFNDLFGEQVKPVTGIEFAQFLQSCLENDFYPESELDQDAWLETFLAFDQPLEYEFQHDQMITVSPHKNADGSITLEHELQNLDIEKMLNKALDDAQLAMQEKKRLLERIDSEIKAPMSDGVLEPLEKLKEVELAPEHLAHLELALKSGYDILTSLNDMTTESQSPNK